MNSDRSATALPTLHRCVALGMAIVGSAHAVPSHAQQPDLELGEYLAAECTTCHRPDAVNQGIPVIFGIPKFVLTQALEQYRDGSRFNEAMRNVARSLSPEEIAAVAAYLEQAKPGD